MQDSDAPQNNDIKKWMGKADWIWNEELELHLPSCIVVVEGLLLMRWMIDSVFLEN